jgi:hypothetical protein
MKEPPRRTAEVWKNVTGSWTVYTGYGWVRTPDTSHQRMVAQTEFRSSLSTWEAAMSVARAWTSPDAYESSMRRARQDAALHGTTFAPGSTHSA